MTVKTSVENCNINLANINHDCFDFMSNNSLTLKFRIIYIMPYYVRCNNLLHQSNIVLTPLLRFEADIKVKITYLIIHIFGSKIYWWAHMFTKAFSTFSIFIA